MKHSTLKQLLFMIICCTSIPVAYAADSVSATESLADSLKSSKSDGVTTYYTATAGKFSVTIKIGASSFADAGLSLADITENSTIEISVGDYSVSSSLSEAVVPHTLTSSKISAKWIAYHDGACKDADCTEYKQVKDTTTSLTGGSTSGITLKIDGTSSATDGALSYGKRVFADICDTASDGAVETADATLSINGISFTNTVQFTCSVKTRPQTKGGESFNLVTTKILKAKKI